ncbi:hypothetical protein V865_007528 [Kwoniella europaea PYCC6329]|uniref:Uncharacterized protein n=1 Tax=Kwoniella europaea PYCC6329 TaxID=1423913 RepID=A0AAX4KV01_9TREE
MLATQPTPIYHPNTMSWITTTPGWDEQIVPTLKKRLESESQYLTKRLSAASFEDQHRHQPPTSVSSSSSKLNSFPQSPTFGVFQQTQLGPSSPFSSGIPRSRTKSGPFLNDTRQLNSNNGGQSNGKRPSPRIDTSSTSSPKIPSTAAPSRIPTRPRSKSQLTSSSPRPSPVHSKSQPPPLPTTSISGIPVLTTRSRSRSPSKRLPPTKMSVAVMENRRESLELGLGGTRIREGFIKNELPPFKMNPNEALRIAEKGHELNDEESSNYRTSYDSSRMAERKRSISMKPNNLHPKPNGHMMERSGSSGSDRSARRNSRPSTSSAATGTRGYGISTSHTGLGLGMGQPSSSSRLSNGRTTQRAGSSRSPINGSPSTAFNAPRSASLNLLSGSPSMSMNGTPPNARLGVAAHFIPPESSYTPPKGTDWDDVVLPTVAKKLGINESEREGGGGVVVGEEDLAVEWDKDGTPIRWVKRKIVSGGNGSARVGLGLGDSTGSQNSIQSNDTTPTRTHAFSPTFEPSPDNPLQPRQRPSSASLRNRPSASSDMELTTLRTTNGQPISLGQPIDRSSSPSRNNAYYPGGEPFPNTGSGMGVHRKTNSQNISTSSPISGLGSNPALNRKPSTLKKQNHSTPTVSRQGSELSLRTRNASNVARNNNSNNNFGPGLGSSQNGHGNGQMSIPGTTHRITDAIYENQLANREGRVNEKVGAGGGGKARKDDDMHGKGCGCLIM